MTHGSPTANGTLVVAWLGSKSYEEGLREQEALVTAKIAGDSNNYLLLLEHDPVYTIGRTQDVSSLGNKPLPHPLHRIGRGGQATYHGPGQLVAYPIIDLSVVGRDLHHYLRLLEEVIIQTLAFYQIEGCRRDGMTGVWVNNKKIASLGVGVRKWISFHGLALNICGDLTPFESITPCGLSGVEMTSMKEELKLRNQGEPVPQLAQIFHTDLLQKQGIMMNTSLDSHGDLGGMAPYSLVSQCSSLLSHQALQLPRHDQYEISGLDVLSVGKKLSGIFERVVLS